jgi:hypothetical protein
MIINLTAGGVLESTIMYGVVHGIWVGIRWITNRSAAELRRERNRIIHHHVKNGHDDRLKHCKADACIKLRKSEQIVPELPVFHLD